MPMTVPKSSFFASSLAQDNAANDSTKNMLNFICKRDNYAHNMYVMQIYKSYLLNCSHGFGLLTLTIFDDKYNLNLFDSMYSTS